MMLSVRNKLFLSALFAVATTCAVGLAGYAGIEHIERAMDVVAENTRALRHQGEADMLHDTLRADVYAALHDGNRASFEGYEQVISEVKGHGARMIRAQEQARRYAPAGVKPLMDAAKAALQRYVDGAADIAELAYVDRDRAVARLPDFQAAFTALEEELRKISAAIEQSSALVQEKGREAVQGALAIIVAVGVVATLLLMAASWLIGRGIIVPLDRAVRASAAVAAGDLTVRIEAASDDEIGRLLAALESMRADLAAAVGDIHAAARNVSTGSREIARGNADLSSRTEEQATSLEEAASSMEEITSAAKQNTRSARQANELARGASTIAGRGGDAVRSVVETMGGISEASRRIAEITSVIDGIAFQTNILALNAAVEAARAGDQGRGFAVVASEVRALAQRCTGAAREIKGLIEDSASRVNEGARRVEGAGETIGELVASVERVTGIVSEIAEASDEQLRGIEQVSQAVAQMDQVVQQNAALVEESAAAAENLAIQAELMAATVGRFKLDAAQLALAAPANEERASEPARSADARTVPAAAAVPRRPRSTRLLSKAGDEWEEF
jgi:methyl-accepting chemotaxis protein